MHSRFERQVERMPDAVAVSNESETATYAEMNRWVARLRPLFRARRGVPVVLMGLPGGPRFTAVQLACMAEGAVLVPVPDRASAREAAGYLRAIRPDIAVLPASRTPNGMDAGLPGALPSTIPMLTLEEPDGDREGATLGWAAAMEGADWPPAIAGTPDLPPETQLIQFTSGSTGTPKGILLTRENIRTYLDHNAIFLSEFAGRSAFCPMPQFHAFGGTVVLEHLSAGASVHLSNRFAPGTDLARMEAAGCEILLSAPTYPRLLMQLGVLDRKHLPELRMLVMGAAAADPALLTILRERFPDLEIVLRYGLTETMGPIARLRLGPSRFPEDEAPVSGRVGRPAPGVTVADGLPAPGEGDPGEVRVSGPTVAAGRLSARDRWEPLAGPDGFFPTGDLGYRSPEGDLYLRGRISAFIKSNGYRVNPFEIEELLRSHVGVAEAAVVGIPDDVAGERIVARVEPAAAGPAPTVRDLYRLLRENLLPYKVPNRVTLVESLPRNATGKVDRAAVSRMASD